MEKVTLYLEGEPVGELTAARDGPRAVLAAVMYRVEPGICRAVLIGELGECPLGVMEPRRGGMDCRRQVYSRDLAALGPLLRGEVRTARVQWRKTDCPAGLLPGGYIRRRLADVDCGWWRRQGEKLVLALPMESGRPFPLPCCFCLAREERVQGRRCAVFTFGPDGEPVAEEK